MEVDQYRKDGNEQNIKLDTVCMTNTEEEARTMTDVIAATNSISAENCESNVTRPSEENINILKLENYTTDKSNSFVTTSTVEASGQWTTAQMQTPNQTQGVGYSFPWSEIVSDTQRLNNDLLTLLDTNGGMFSENGGNSANTQVIQANEESDSKNPESDLQDLDSCSQSQSMSETSTTDSSSQLTDECELYNYVYFTFPSQAQSTCTSTTTTTTPATPVGLPQTKVECLQSGFSTPNSAAPIFPVPAIALPMSEAMTNAQLEKNKKVSRRREKNKECSRQFRLKQKQKLIKLKEGRVQKEQHLITLHKVLELKVRNLQNILGVGCEKAREIFKSNSMESIEVIKENIPM